MSNIQSVQDFITTRKILSCDDCLSDELNIKPRQQVNQICNNLMKKGFLNRVVRQCESCSKYKLINIKV